MSQPPADEPQVSAPTQRRGIIHGMVATKDGRAQCVAMNVPHNDPPPQETPPPPQAHPHHEDLQVRGPFPTFGMVVNGASGVAVCQQVDPIPLQSAAAPPKPAASQPTSAAAATPSSGSTTPVLPINEAIVLELVSLGFHRVRAENAVYLSGNSTTEAAALYLLEHSNDSTLDLPLAARLAGKRPSTDIKMVLVVRQDLGLSVGKTSAQCCHAAVALYRKMQKKHPEFLKRWEGLGEAKIVLQGKDDKQLAELASRAEALGLPWYYVADAGRTEIAPGTQTVLGIAGPVDTVNLVTGNLRLLK